MKDHTLLWAFLAITCFLWAIVQIVSGSGAPITCLVPLFGMFLTWVGFGMVISSVVKFKI